MSDTDLISLAKRARQSAYAPYSGFMVGSALLTRSGKVFCGCNVENAAFGACTCAERGAISAAVLAGETDFVALAVIGSSEKHCTPCGICRQILAEFSTNCRVLCANENSDFVVRTACELLPDGFTL